MPNLPSSVSSHFPPPSIPNFAGNRNVRCVTACDSQKIGKSTQVPTIIWNARILGRISVIIKQLKIQIKIIVQNNTKYINRSYRRINHACASIWK